MPKQAIMWALMCTTAPLVCAAEPIATDSNDLDSTEYSISPQFLNEITVTASPVARRNDRRIIRPPKDAVGSARDGIDLLRRLHVPGISINPLTDVVTAAGGAAVVLCIDGVEASEAQIAAVRPADVVRIEYHDRPGVRYADAAAVIDYITVRHYSGGSLMLDAFGALAPGRYASLDHLAGQYNSGRSVWSANAGFLGQRKDRWTRDYRETWHYPGSTITRQERGLPVDVGGAGMESVLNYNYMNPRGDMLNVRLGFDLNDVPRQEQGDRRALLETSDSDVPVVVTEHTAERSHTPAVGVYYLHQLSEGQCLTFDLRGSWMRSHMVHEYAENGLGESSRVDGDKYSAKFTGLYERRAGSRVWSVGLTGSASDIRNVYRQHEPVKVAVAQTQSALVGEYSDRFGPWGTVVSLRAAYNRMSQAGRRIDGFFILPAVNLSWRPAPKYFLRYAASLDCAMPGAAEISDVSRTVQSGMIRRGNPALRPFRIIDQSLTASFESRFVSAEATVDYRHEHRPIMESVIYEDGGFVRTYFNQRSFRRLTVGATLSVRPWQNHLTITAEPVLNRYFSRGLDYRHCHSIFRVVWSVDFSYGRWLACAGTMSGPENRMYGEEIIEETDMNQIMVGYKRSRWSLHLGVFNAFIRNYRMETRNLSALTPYTSEARSDRSSAYAAVRLNLSLDFGRRGRDVDVPDADFDSDSGILTGTK